MTDVKAEIDAVKSDLGQVEEQASRDMYGEALATLDVARARLRTVYQIVQASSGPKPDMGHFMAAAQAAMAKDAQK
ncbi:MAG: hypothetical protein OXR67_01430 [Chloroflexota bacterium]|nr:hypothetical protein [Chloroflexota bacterium]